MSLRDGWCKIISGIRFFGASGCLGLLGELGHLPLNTINRAVPLLEIFNLVTSDTSSPTRVGFFGLNKPPSSPVIVGQYQTYTFRTGHFGTDQGEMINVKFLSSTNATVSGTFRSTGFLPNVAINTIPGQSGTLLVRFKEPNDTLNITQNGVFRAVNLTAASGAADTTTPATGVLIQAAQLLDTQGNASDTTWTQIGGTGSPTSLGLADQSSDATVHDYHLIVSANPENIGTKRDFGFYISVESL